MKHLMMAVAVAALCVACSPVTEPPVTEETEQTRSVTSEDLLKSLPELSDALTAGEISSAGLITAYLERIDTVDRSGPTLRSVLTINPDALAQAKASDARRADGKALGPLDGVPILIKDNIETLDPMPTTAGALALKDNLTGRDSPLVANLRAQGAVILGKTNLSQWANFRSVNSASGWSALGGQVRNPHILDHNPCGSSSGSGVAVAASLAAGAVGTETNGSIICPAHVNGIVGFKPTVGLISQNYIVPISHSQDTAGPMTKTVRGTAMMLNAMATGDTRTDYVDALDANSLSGTRIGVMRFSVGSVTDQVALFDAALETLSEQGAELVEIDTFTPGGASFFSQSFTALKYEFKAGLNTYLAGTPETVSTRTLSDVIAFNQANAETELDFFGQDIFTQSDALGGLDTQAYLDAVTNVQTASRENGIDRLLDAYDVEMLVGPSGPVTQRLEPGKGDTWPTWVGAGYLAAVAGYPHISIPMGTVNDIPVGFSIMGPRDSDAQILSWGYAYEQASQKRVEPQYLLNTEPADQEE